jgi:nitrogen-specific signal transduction histidine kinase
MENSAIGLMDQQIREILNSVKIGIITIDATLSISYANDYAIQCLSIKNRAIVNTPVSDVLPYETVQSINNCINTGQKDAEYRFLSVDAELIGSISLLCTDGDRRVVCSFPC